MQIFCVRTKTDGGQLLPRAKYGKKFLTKIKTNSIFISRKD